jgi:HD superfamily phosphohydrolase
MQAAAAEDRLQEATVKIAELEQHASQLSKGRDDDAGAKEVLHAALAKTEEEILDRVREMEGLKKVLASERLSLGKLREEVQALLTERDRTRAASRVAAAEAADAAIELKVCAWLLAHLVVHSTLCQAQLHPSQK